MYNANKSYSGVEFLIKLKKVNSDNIWDVIKLSVSEQQKNFVASNRESILEAYATIADGNMALPFAIYNDDTLVGFVMFGYGSTGDEDEPKISAGNYCLWRFMIDSRYQRMGYGKAALQASLDYLHTMPCGPAEYCWLSYEPDNIVAKKLYSSAGFSENGEIVGGEVVSVLKL